jgi:HlyD family secretion protein
MMQRILVTLTVIAVLIGIAGGATWGVRHFLDVVAAGTSKEIPTTTVRKGRVTVSVSARGELQGGNSEVMMVPQAGVNEVPITYLRSTGELVQPGDVVAEFDTTQQEFNVREAEADLAEAEQKVIQAEAEAQAALEEARYQTLATAVEIRLAELEVRKNPLLAATVARQNEITLEAAKNRKQQADRDYKNRLDSINASVAIQRAAESRSRLTAESVRRTIAGMVLKSKTAGYVHRQPNSNGQLLYSGAVVPEYQVGDAARAGQVVALIPDMSSWEVSASVPELDRGYLKAGQSVTVRPAALAGRELRGHIKTLGGTTGSAWNRRFDCRVALDEKDPDLRPGMTANVLITVETLDDVLWVPAQALFESDGRAFLYARTTEGFVQRDVTLVRRSESQAVITGIGEGEVVALSRPDQQDRGTATGKDGGVLKALPK